MLRAPTQVSWKRSVCAMANFHCEVAAYHPLPKTPCAAIGRCASRGCLASLGGPIERLGHLRFVPNPSEGDFGLFGAGIEPSPAFCTGEGLFLEDCLGGVGSSAARSAQCCGSWQAVLVGTVVVVQRGSIFAPGRGFFWKIAWVVWGVQRRGAHSAVGRGRRGSVSLPSFPILFCEWLSVGFFSGAHLGALRRIRTRVRWFKRQVSDQEGIHRDSDVINLEKWVS